MRLADARKDHYRKLAKDQGLRARSAYKLQQINDSHHILKKGSSVVDIGCAPGGWLQIAARTVGPTGRVVGIDLKPVEPVPGTLILQGSIEDPEMIREIRRLLEGRADAVLSDLAPNVSGIWDIDHSRQISLTHAALRFTDTVLKEGGNAVFKVFEGEMLSDLKAELKQYFGTVHMSKPSASRQESSELYAVCLNFKHKIMQ